MNFEGQVRVHQTDKVRGNSMCKARFVLAKVRAKGGPERRDVFSLSCRNHPSGCCHRERSRGGIQGQREPGEGGWECPSQLMAVEMAGQGQTLEIFRRVNPQFLAWAAAQELRPLEKGGSRWKARQG